ncbi:hypothetical protein VTK56DRAFT_7918 [Thermocarpiscus australiensis]
MATSPRSPDDGESLFDSAQPLRGVVICCTSVPVELRSDIAAKTAELGGVHKYDLTPDCTHLIVGEYETPKYRHVAKERPDVKAMATGWVEAVRNLWVQDAEIDFLALEREWQLRTFEIGGGEPTADGHVSPRRKLLCCMTGFEDPDERQQIADKIEANGGVYTGDLTKRVTHLIVCKPEGRKYHAAKNWGIHTVSVEWVNDSIERGMILDEKSYDPVLPKEERGVGAWNKQRAQRVSSLGKRLRENNAAQDDGKRKLRKTASMKLNSQRDNLWGDILGKPQPSGPSQADLSRSMPGQLAPVTTAAPAQPSAGGKAMDTQGSKLSSFGIPDDSAVFASCCFYVHGFSAQKTEILVNTIASLGGLICHSLDEVVSTSGAQLAHRFVIVPQISAPDTHPRLPGNVHIITEFYIERCLHKKYFFDPSQHVIGRPFPSFPIPGFEDLSICTAGFTGVDLNHVDKSVRQLGARYEERFTADISLLVCPSLSVVRKQKLELALAWQVPVVSANWLWECISTGSKVPIERFLFPELKQNLKGPKLPSQSKEQGKGKENAIGKQDKHSSKVSIDKDLLPKPAARPKQRRDLDESAFAPAKEEPLKEPGTTRACQSQHRREPPADEHDTNVTTTTHFATALTHQFQTEDANSSGHKSAPLSEASSNSLNRSPSSPRKEGRSKSRKAFSRIASEVADSEATEGDVCQPSDIPLHEDQENASPDPAAEEVPPTEQQQQQEEEDAKQLDAERAALAEAEAQAEAERRALSTKLAHSLLDLAPASASASRLADASNTDGGTDAPAAAAGGGGGGGGGGGIDGRSCDDNSTGRPKRRKRILGRAVSNVSAASSGSGSGSAAGGGGGAGAGSGDSFSFSFATTAGTKKPRLKSAPAAIESVDSGTTGTDATTAVGGGGGGSDGGPPTATQLEYEDPEAERYKAQLMDKMLGTVAGRRKGAGTTTGGFPERQEKLTLAEMGGYDMQLQQRYDGSGAVAGGRRTRRG